MKQFSFLVVCLFVFGNPGIAQNLKGKKVVKNATTTIQALSEIEESIPQQLIQEAEGIVIFPKAIKAAFGIGGQGGVGIAMIKNEEGEWSNPVFINQGEASVGFQIGIQSSELVLLFKKRENVEKLQNLEVTLGGDIAIAAGPVGRNSQASTDVGFDAEIYSYSRSKGLFAGISIEGTVLKLHQKLNNDYYNDSEITVEDIFYYLPTPFKDDVEDLRAALINAG